MKYEKWLSEWLESCIKPSSKCRTYARYSEIAKRHVIPNLGDKEIEELTPIALQRYVNRLSECGNLKNGRALAPNSVNAIVSVICSSLRAAYDFGCAAVPVGDKIKRPKMQEKKIECFTSEEQRRIEGYILRRQGSMLGVILCLYTGIRIGELLALEWRDVDFEKSELTVSKSCHVGRDKNGKFTRITETPKTASSIRTIPIPNQISGTLRALKKDSSAPYVISNGGAPISARSYQRSFSLALERLGLPHRGFHSLRHTFATRALECGMDVKTLAEILGHKNPTVTLNRYAHSLREHKKEMMDKVGMLFERSF